MAEAVGQTVEQYADVRVVVLQTGSYATSEVTGAWVDIRGYYISAIDIIHVNTPATTTVDITRIESRAKYDGLDKPLRILGDGGEVFSKAGLTLDERIPFAIANGAQGQQEIPHKFIRLIGIANNDVATDLRVYAVLRKLRTLVA